jgi:hypothetical protein
MAGRGDDLPVSACRSTAPSPPRRPSGRSAASPSRSRSGIRTSASSAASAPGLPARGDPREGLRPVPAAKARRRPSRAPTQGKEFKGSSTRSRSRPEDCTGCGSASSLPGQEQEQAEPQGDQHGSQPPLREPERTNYDFFLDLPEFDRAKLKHGHGQGLAVPPSRCSSTPAPAPAAARRPTSSCSASSSATARSSPTRPAAPHLRRQPADHAVGQEPRRPRPGLVQLAVRGQRRVRLRLPPLPSTSRPRTGPRAGQKAGPANRRRPRTGLSRGRPDRRSRASPSSASGSRR